MLQTNTTNNSGMNSFVPQTDKQADIVKKIQELSKWQEEQKKLLEAKQTMQRQMLGMEQRTMYQMLGLQATSESEVSEAEEVQQEGDGRESDLENNGEACEEEDNAEDDYNEDEGRKDDPSSFKTLTSGYATEDYIEVKRQKPKKPFLKRGEGLKQRFKIDPDELRLNNLPRYKYANAHPRLRLKPPGKPNNIGAKQSKLNHNSPPKALKPIALATLDAQEQRFQNLLISSKNTFSSTPDTKSSFSSQKSTTSTTCNSSSTLTQVRVIESKAQMPKTNREKGPPNEMSPPPVTPTVAWSKILDSQQLTPLEVPRTRLQTLPQSEESIFELLEEQANNGSFDMDSSCIKQFMQRRLKEKLNDTEDNIPVKDEIKTMRLKPLVHQEKEEHYFSDQDDEEIVDEQTELTEDVETTESEETTHKTVETTNSSYGPQTQQVRVRFSDSNETHEYENETAGTLDNSTRLSAGANVGHVGQGDTTNNEFFDQFKQALFAALQNKADQHLENDTASDATLTPKDSLVNINNNTDDNSIFAYPTQELQEKTDLIKMRLSELEKEINNFKENNILLMKAKQQHELEKSVHAQEHLEAMERLKDEKIQMEIYLHDERVKLEDEKRQFEQSMKMKNQGLIAKQRKENEMLKEQVAKLESELKAKDINHTSAQARLRTQIRSLEKDQKQLHDQIEALRRDNKRLENENLRISREQNNKMLQEINRNIAKLAPKQMQNSTTSMPEEGPPTISTKRTMSKCIVAAATANKNVRLPTKKYGKTNKTTSTKFPNIKPPPNAPSPPTSADADTTPEELSFTEEEIEQKLQKQYNFNNEDGDDDDGDEDILREFQTATTNRNSNSQAVQQKKREENVIKGLPNSEPVPPPPSPRANNMKREIVNSDGSKDVWYPNGNLKKISADGMIIRMLYYNKDIKETNINEGTVKYYYAETNTWHTTYLDGLEILEFPNGQVEHRHKDGIVEVHYPNNSIKIVNPKDEHKQEEWRYADGTHLVQLRNGDKILSLPNGQKEIHNKLHKRREYPDGTVKIVYPDGSTETRYSNGRVRLKDKDGKLVMDTDLAK